jgi:hypothetical protein
LLSTVPAVESVIADLHFVEEDFEESLTGVSYRKFRIKFILFIRRKKQKYRYGINVKKVGACSQLIEE